MEVLKKSHILYVLPLTTKELHNMYKWILKYGYAAAHEGNHGKKIAVGKNI